MKSQLHQKIGTNGNDIFNLTLGNETLTDHEITEISITRGQSGYSYGVQPSTMSFRVAGLKTSKNNEHVELKLSDWASQHISTLTGMPADIIRPRFYGRVGLQDSEDKGSTSTTSLSASSYSSLLRATTRTYTVYNRTVLANVIRAILEHPSMPNRLKTFPASYGPNDWDETYIEGTKEMTFSQIVNEYVQKQLILICERRDGRMHVQNLSLREGYLKERASSRYAPLRSHTLSPATWSQSLESRSKHLILKERTRAGIVQRNWGSGTAIQTQNDYPVEQEEIDLTHVTRLTDNNDRVMTALNYQNNVPIVHLGSVSFDLTYMLTANDWYTRRTAGELLRLEHGDAVYFSGDWPGAIRTPMIAQQIKETITPSRWLMDIELLHPSAVLGIHDIPQHPPRVWDQMDKNTWDDQQKTWNEF